MSEWIHVFPNQWGAEGPAILSAYGFGLQGWDISYIFQNSDNGGYATVIPSSFGQSWLASAPHILAPFPAQARAIYRNDISESNVEAKLNVHVDSLIDFKHSFADRTTQAYDVKSFTTDKVPEQTLAVAKTRVHFVDEYTDTDAFPLEDYRDSEGALVSDTKQLRWMPGNSSTSGYFTINTDATKGVVGFAQNEPQQLGSVSIEKKNRYGLIYVTAASKDGTIATDDRILISATGRCHNKGMKYLGTDFMHLGDVKRNDKGPVFMEAVIADITINRSGTPTVYVCDHDGNRT